MMDWHTLLNPTRPGSADSKADLGRSPFQKDVDRIVFSSAFRRLQDKTQVHPLPLSDYVRTRLTHSIEVASLGRSLATRVGQTILSRHPLTGLSASDFGDVVAAACLAHDIGNPPFGHAGESAIQQWFHSHPHRLHGLSQAEQADFLYFEGNAQGFRNIKPLNLTAATLGTFTKYPRGSWVVPQEGDVGGKKHGFFMQEADLFAQLAQAVGLIAQSANAPYWSRHPLAFLMEAADDICYTIVDVEDGYKLGKLSFEEAQSWLASLSDPESLERYPTHESPDSQISTLRGYAIGHLVTQAGSAFLDLETQILSGTLSTSLLAQLPCFPTFCEMGTQTAQKVFMPYETMAQTHQHSLVLGDLMGAMLDALNNKPMPAVLQKQLLAALGNPGPGDTPYIQLLRVTDYVSGMTDSYALQLHHSLAQLL